MINVHSISHPEWIAVIQAGADRGYYKNGQQLEIFLSGYVSLCSSAQKSSVYVLNRVFQAIQS